MSLRPVHALATLGAFAAVSLFLHYADRIALSRAIAARARAGRWERASADKTIVVVGDSTGVGVGAAGPHESVAGRLAEHFPHAHVFNYAVSGALARDAEEQLARHGDRPIDLLLAQVCANDVFEPLSLGYIEATMRRIIARGHRSGALVVLMPGCDFSYAPFFRPLFVPPQFAWRARKLHRLLQSVAADTGAIYVDLFHIRPDHAFFREGHRYFCEDGLHPSGEGYALWFEELAKRVPLADRLGLREAA